MEVGSEQRVTLLGHGTGKYSSVYINHHNMWTPSSSTYSTPHHHYSSYMHHHVVGYNITSHIGNITYMIILWRRLFCGGDCQQWLHRYCAGVSAQVYRSMTAFSCYACSLVTHRKEIDDLKDAVELLRGEIAELKSATSGSRLGTSSSNPSSLRVSAMVSEGFRLSTLLCSQYSS